MAETNSLNPSMDRRQPRGNVTPLHGVAPSAAGCALQAMENHCRTRHARRPHESTAEPARAPARRCRSRRQPSPTRRPRAPLSDAPPHGTAGSTRTSAAPAPHGRRALTSASRRRAPHDAATARYRCEPHPAEIKHYERRKRTGKKRKENGKEKKKGGMQLTDATRQPPVLTAHAAGEPPRLFG